jgi:fatty acid desaturase
MEDGVVVPHVRPRRTPAAPPVRTSPTPLAARRWSTADVAAHFPKAARGRVALAAFAYWLGFYGGFALYVGGLVPGWAFATIGLLVFVRYFDLTHEEIHTRDDRSRLWGALRLVFSVSGPLQLGYAQLARAHRHHHAHDGSEKDPDAWIMQASPGAAVFHCLTQPEQAVFRHIGRYGVDLRLVFDLCLHFAAWTAMACLCEGTQFLLYNAVVRVGNGASWFVFTYVLHRTEVYRGFAPVRLPRWLRAAWLVAIGRNNLNAITYHFLHHAYGFVPARSLPALSAELAARAGTP